MWPSIRLNFSLLSQRGSLRTALSIIRHPLFPHPPRAQCILMFISPFQTPSKPCNPQFYHPNFHPHPFCFMLLSPPLTPDISLPPENLKDLVRVKEVLPGTPPSSKCNPPSKKVENSTAGSSLSDIPCLLELKPEQKGCCNPILPGQPKISPPIAVITPMSFEKHVKSRLSACHSTILKIPQPKATHFHEI